MILKKFRDNHGGTNAAEISIEDSVRDSYGRRHESPGNIPLDSYQSPETFLLCQIRATVYPNERHPAVTILSLALILTVVSCERVRLNLISGFGGSQCLYIMHDHDLPVTSIANQLSECDDMPSNTLPSNYNCGFQFIPAESSPSVIRGRTP